MQRNSLVLLLGAVLMIGAGVVLVPHLLDEPEGPIVRWKATDEVEVAAEPAEPQVAEGAPGEPAVERSAVALEAAPSDAGDRVDVLLRGRVVDKFKAPIASATVWLDFGRGGGRGQGGPNGRQRRVPDPVQTDADGRFAFQGQTFRNLRVSLQVAHATHAPGMFDKDVGTVGAEVDLGELLLNNGGEVRGRVTDLDGNGIAGATLRLGAENDNPLRFLRDRDRLLPTFTTDNNGYYRRAHAGAGDWSLTATAKRHTEGRSTTFAVEEDQAVDVEDIRLGPGYEVTGTVRDTRGQPIAKANVVLQSLRNRGNGAQGNPTGDNNGRNGNDGGRGGPGGGRGPNGGGREHRATTDERGNFFLEHLPGAAMRVDVDADGFLDLRVDEIDPTLGQPLQLTMQDGLRIDGKVVDGDGNAVTSFAFRALRLRNLPAPGQTAVDWNAMMTRMRDGNLSEAERAELRTQMESMRDQWGGGRGGRGGPGGGPMARGGGNNDAGGPGRAGRDLGKAEAHPGGTFAATGLQEGVYEVHVQSPDHARYRSAEVEVRFATAAPQLQITLDNGVFVAGVVRNADGQPVRGATVELRQPSSFDAIGQMMGGRRGRGNGTGNAANAANGGAAAGNGPDWQGMARDAQRQFGGASLTLDATTDDEGEFLIKHAPRGTYRLQVEAKGHASHQGDAFELANDRSDFAITLGALAAVAGTVRGLRPGEAGEARVAAVPMGGGQGMGAMFRGRGNGGPGGGGGPLQGVAVAADGSYRIADLVPGEYLVRAWVGSAQDVMRELMPRFLDGSLQADAVVQAGATTRLDVDVMRPQVGSVTGTVVHNGNPATGFQVELTRQDDGRTNGGNGNNGGRGGRGFGFGFGGTFQTAVAASGRFTIQNVPAGSYRLRVSSSRRNGTLHEEVVQVVSEAATERSIAVQTYALQGEVTVDDGSNAADLAGRVSLLPGLNAEPENLGQWQRDNQGFDARLQQGKFRFEALAPGNYLLVLNPRGRERTSLAVVIPGTTSVTIPAGKASANPQGARNGNGGPGGAKPGGQPRNQPPGNGR